MRGPKEPLDKLIPKMQFKTLTPKGPNPLLVLPKPQTVKPNSQSLKYLLRNLNSMNKP